MQRRERERAWRRAYFVTFAIFVALVVLGILIVALSGTDRKPYCGDPKPPFEYRPIESRHYGTPAGAPFSRVLGGRSPATYWTNDTTPVQVTDALCEPSLDLTDPHNPVPHRPVVTLFPFWGQFITHSFALQRGDVTKPPLFSHLARGFPGVHPSEFIVDAYGAQQINTISPYLANSANYGHTDELALSLRTLDGTGCMKFSSSPHHDGHLLPIGLDGNFTSGDVRTRENYMLTAMHTLFIREHNHWAHVLAEENPSWSEDRLYHTARHIVIAEIQSITYNEWLPTLLNTKDLFGRPACFHSNSRLTIRNAMSTAAMRMGHTFIPNHLEARDINIGNIVPGLGTSFFEAFMQPLNQSVLYLYDIDSYLLGALYQRAELFDTKITGALMGGIFNLGGFNIARGRDHGLPSYQRAFEDVTGYEFRSIRQDVTSNDKLAVALEQVYGDGPIDLWIGILSERKVNNSIMGVVGSYLISEQFAFMRDADFYYYEWDDVITPWRDVIHATRLRDILRRNTKINDELLQGRSFFHQ